MPCSMPSVISLSRSRLVGFILSHDFQSPFQVCDFCCVFCNPCLLFFFTFIKKKVQQVLYIGFLLDCFHKAGGAVLPPVSWENGRLPIFSADSSNQTVHGNSAVDPPETSVPRFLPDIISCGAGPDCHRSGQSPVPVSPPLLLGRGQRALR